jgi:glucokinase
MISGAGGILSWARLLKLEMAEIDLIADIGGTNARMAFRAGSAPWSKVTLRQAADFASLEALIADVIAESGTPPTRAVLAVPGPASGDAIQLTNLPWRIDRAALQGKIGVRELTIMNDLEAVALSLPYLTTDDVVTWRAGQEPRAARVVVAPGTGLGIGALAPSGAGWTAVPSEGGHVEAVVPRSTPERLRRLWDARPCWEDLLSGSGLLRLYLALGAEAATPADVTARAEKNDARALEAIGFFSELLGVCAGDMAIIFGAKGGCYIAGGVVPALGRLFDVARFIAGFSEKGPYGDYVNAIPLRLISHPYPALVGLAGFIDPRATSLGR